MAEDKFISSVAEFLEACEGEAPVLMDADAYAKIIDFVAEQARDTSDANTRKALNSLLSELAEPIAAYRAKQGENSAPDTVHTLGGLLHLSESIRGGLLQTIGKSSPEEMEILRSIIPQKAVINVSKLAAELTRDLVGADAEIIVSKKSAKKEIDIIVSMTIEETNLKITGRQPYTAYDRAVLNGICSLWQAGNTAFTAAMVYRAMNGMTGTDDGGARVSPQAVGAVTRSIEKQRVTRLTIDCTEQMKHYKGLSRAKFDAMMISVDGVEMTAQNGQRVKAYTFTNPARPPVLYEYSRSINQVLTIPPRLLNSSGTIRTTEEVIAIREYLIRRIEGMRGNNSLRADRIAYRGIYRELGIDIDGLTGNALKDVPKRVRKNTEALLCHFQSEGFITGFSSYKDGHTIAGVQIRL